MLDGHYALVSPKIGQFWPCPGLGKASARLTVVTLTGVYRINLMNMIFKLKNKLSDLLLFSVKERVHY